MLHHLKLLVGLAVLWLLTLGVLQASASGIVTISFDDGLSGVYKVGLPILKKYNFPGVVGVFYKKMISGDPAYINLSELKNLQENGWEIASQGLSWAKASQVPKFISQEPIRGWRLDNDARKVYQAPYSYDLVLGLIENGRNLTPSDNLADVEATPGSYYHDQLIEELHVRPFKPLPPENLEIRAVSFEREMLDSREELRKLGFKVYTFAAPFNYWPRELEAISSEYYKYVLTGWDNANLPGSLKATSLMRFTVRTADTPNAITRIVREHAVEKGEWVILCLRSLGNGGRQPWSAENLEKLCAWLSENKVEVLTVTQAMQRLNPKQH